MIIKGIIGLINIKVSALHNYKVNFILRSNICMALLYIYCEPLFLVA